jgi:hypothetical protein
LQSAQTSEKKAEVERRIGRAFVKAGKIKEAKFHFEKGIKFL